MKKTVLSVACAAATIAATARTLEVTIPNVRSDRGNLLLMARIEGREEPVYGMAAARTDSAVVILLAGIDARAAEVSLFHDEDGDYRMKMGDRGPEEGYARCCCRLESETETLTVMLHYPAAATHEATASGPDANTQK